MASHDAAANCRVVGERRRRLEIAKKRVAGQRRHLVVVGEPLAAASLAQRGVFERRRRHAARRVRQPEGGERRAIGFSVEVCIPAARQGYALLTARRRLAAAFSPP